jgi:integrase
MQPLIVLALETAMRQGELTSIRWDNINLSRRTIFISDSKNNESRTVPLSSRAVSTLKKVPRTLDSQLVFPIKNPSRKFSDICKKAKIQDLRFHDLRHEATSRLFEKGFNPMEVASITGHKTLTWSSKNGQLFKPIPSLPSFFQILWGSYIPDGSEVFCYCKTSLCNL